MDWIDSAYLPETKGTLDRFLLNPHGDADGLLLTDGMEVHFPPHMSKPVVAATGGGVSAYVATPSWQVGSGVPVARTGRYTPDVSFSAASHDGYFGCLAAGGGSCITNSQGSTSFVVFSGTSAAAPAMAGVAALLNERMGNAQGNLNPNLYQTATQTPTAFNDVTVATSGATNCSVNTPSMCNNSIPGPTGLSGGQAGYLAGTGYDEVTGLGSLNIGNFLNGYAGKIVTQIAFSNLTTIPASQQLNFRITVSGGQANWFCCRHCRRIYFPTRNPYLRRGEFFDPRIHLARGTGNADRHLYAGLGQFRDLQHQYSDRGNPSYRAGSHSQRDVQPQPHYGAATAFGLGNRGGTQHRPSSDWIGHVHLLYLRL